MKAIWQATLLAALGTFTLAADVQADWAYDYNTSQLPPGILPSSIDPGSYQYVNRYFTDPYGSTWHEVGPAWTSGGVPQSQLSRQLVNQGYYAYPRHVATPFVSPGIGVGLGIAPGIGINVGIPFGSSRGYGYGYGHYPYHH